MYMDVRELTVDQIFTIKHIWSILNDGTTGLYTTPVLGVILKLNLYPQALDVSISKKLLCHEIFTSMIVSIKLNLKE